MKKLLAILVALASIFQLLTSNVDAQYGQYGPYGGPEPSLSIMVDKMVGKPVANKGDSNGDYVDNLSPSDPRFVPGQEVFFKIKVKNTSDIKLKSVTVNDVLNKAEAFDGDVSDEDTAQFCVEKEVMGVTAVPSAGPEQGVALLLGQFSLLGLGILLKRKSS